MADIEKLIQDLQSEDFEIRLAACKQLGDMPDLPDEAIEALREAAGDSDPLIAMSAYQILEDHIYGAPSATADLTPLSQPSPAPIGGAAPACSVCGRQDETLRQVVFPYLFSFLVVTFRRAFAGFWCRKHSTLYLFLASSITATIGWLGIPFGLVFTPLALFKLARGGDQPEETNIQLLSDLAEHKLMVGDSPGAIRCLEAALQIKDDEVIRDRLKELYRTRMLSTSKQGYSPALSVISVMLGAATIGVTIGIMDYLSIVIFSPFIGEEVSIFLTILSWIPLVALAFLGGLILRKLIVWGLTRAGVHQMALSISLAAIAALLALYGIAEGKAIGQYVDQLQAGMEFNSLNDALLTSGAILTRGGVFTILDAINFLGLGGVIYVLIILVCAAYYFTTSVSGAIRITQWQQILNEIRTGFSTREERSYQSAWISIAGVVMGLALFTSFFLQQDVVGVDAAISHNEHGMELYEQGEVEEAILEYKEAIHLLPDFAPAHSNLGWAYHHQGETEKAIAEFQVAIDLDPNLAEAHQGLGWVYFWMGEMDAAGQAFETVIDLGPSDGTVQAGLGITYLDQDRIQDAEDLLTTALNLAPDFFLTHYGLGKLHQIRSDLDMAAFHFEEAIRLEPQFLQTYFDLAWLYIGRAEFAKAVEGFEVLINFQQESGAPHAGLASAYFQMDQPELVEQELQYALAFAAEDYYTHFLLGNIYSEMHEFSAAETHLQTAVELMPDEAYLYHELAGVYTAQKKFAQAHEACDTAMELNPDDSDTYLARANIYVEQEQLDLAHEDLQRAAEMSPESWYIHSALSFVYYHLGQVTKALEEAKTAVRLNQYGAPAHANLAFAYHMQGELEQALLSAKEAVRLNPKNEWGHYILGLCYMDEGENEKAITEFETFLELYWDRAYARDYKVQAEEFLAELR